MAINSALEPDDYNRTQSTSDKNASNSQHTSNETTIINGNVDTYFSDEKIPIPDKVSSSLITPVIHPFHIIYYWYKLIIIFSFLGRIQFSKVMGIYWSRLSNVHSLFGSGQY